MSAAVKIRGPETEECGDARPPAADREIAVKICGLKTKEDAALCLRLGADRLGFVVEYPMPVPWNLSQSEATDLLAEANRLAPGRTCVVTGGAPDKVVALALSLRPAFVQLHGRESAAETGVCAAALRREGIGLIRTVFPDMTDDALKAYAASGACALLLDPRAPENAASGGAANAALFRRVADLTSLPLILAGGITASNVRRLLAETGAAHIDVMSGAESAPGVKDAEKIAALLRATRAARADRTDPVSRLRL
jgi:phosphoribosylanthranilate isomerase